ncbi:DUF6318 family protein [Arthrobacter burdickii]|uniref:DUF6318 family protein n=1 Tax=Arthrobacter burdickii TaxID=3035920 RepID=A0ABT8K165_9MICC|nr:DUF6318 family protein [Arthrobacter burdickii]MDN4611169.1 DUF6318 family protein [Arthrobacter burdickii]
MLLTGCQGNGGPSANETQSQPSSTSAPPTAEVSASATSSSGPEPSPASSAGPAANIPVPVKPALADENSKEGLEAFTKYWLELFSYGYETNDWAPFEAVTDPGCRTCGNLSQAVKVHYSSGGWIQGGTISLNSSETGFEKNTTGSINSFVDITQDEIVYFNSSGDEVKKTAQTPSTIGVSIAFWEDDHWVMLDFGSPEGT